MNPRIIKEGRLQSYYKYRVLYYLQYVTKQVDKKNLDGDSFRQKRLIEINNGYFIITLQDSNATYEIVIKKVYIKKELSEVIRS